MLYPAQYKGTQSASSPRQFPLTQILPTTLAAKNLSRLSLPKFVRLRTTPSRVSLSINIHLHHNSPILLHARFPRLNTSSYCLFLGFPSTSSSLLLPLGHNMAQYTTSELRCPNSQHFILLQRDQSKLPQLLFTYCGRNVVVDARRRVTAQQLP